MLIFSDLSGSNLTLFPVDQPSVSSGEYTCTVTFQSENTLIPAISGSDNVTLSVLGEYVWITMPSLLSVEGSGKCVEEVC